MLNISKNKINEHLKLSDYSILERVENKTHKHVLLNILKWSLIIFIVILFLPWTQNIRTNGSVITLRPEQKPQTINSVIDGRVEKWFYIEGSQVKKGDTIAYITEVKDAYFDKDLLPRTLNQKNLKEQSVNSYKDKVSTLGKQIEIIATQRDLKLQQAKIKLMQAELKVQNDSIAYVAAQTDYLTAFKQYTRMDSLYNEGLKSLTDLENRKVKMQQSQSKEIEANNKLLASKSELINAKIEISDVQLKYENDLAKLNTEIFTTESIIFDSEASVNKLENEYTNYEVRTDYHYIIANQDGYLTNFFQKGIGEIVKAGEPVATIMPDVYELAVEIYVNPIDLPLMKIGKHVRIQFDGWPAIVFSGWPNVSHGTYGGTVYAIDQFISPNGKYRLLVSPDKNDVRWPKELRYGSGTSCFLLLGDVPIWYELWRQINGFPPDYYVPDVNMNYYEKKYKNVKPEDSK